MYGSGEKLDFVQELACRHFVLKSLIKIFLYTLRHVQLHMYKRISIYFFIGQYLHFQWNPMLTLFHRVSSITKTKIVNKSD